MGLRTLFLLLFCAITLFSCTPDGSSDTKKSDTEKNSTIVEERFKTGQVIENVICKTDPSQNYTLYLPSTYLAEKKFPVIYAFDPHASGKLPVTLYKELAEQYNYIIIGSNNSKNGNSWEESQTIAAKLFADAGSRLSIDPQRIYLLGFSGGARVANTLTIVNGAINSVICCGAAAPVANSSSPRNNYCFMGITGNEDFNYIEMKKYDMVDLAGHNIKHTLITFSGKHEWPSKAIMDEAFWWLELNEMRKNSASKNEKLIAEHLQPLSDRLAVYNKKKQVVEAYNLCRKIINFYDGITDLSSCYETYKTIKLSPEIDKALKQEERDWSEEEALKKQYISAFQTQNLAWWNKDIAALNKKIKTGKDTSKVLIYKRVLSFLSLVAYMQTSGALKQNAFPAAELYSKIYLLVDPTNSEAHYLAASVEAIKGNQNGSLSFLKKAIENGFEDSLRLKNDTIFNGIRNTKEFDEMIKGIAY